MLKEIKFILVIVLFLSCKNSDQPGKTDTPKEPVNTLSASDNINKITVDDFPVPDRVLGNLLPSSIHMKSGKVRSINKVWLTNDSLSQTLVFELSSNYHRLYTFLFSNNAVPKGLIQMMMLHTNTGFAEEKEKIENFEGLVKQAKNGGKEYFTTVAGLKLGDPKEKIIDMYGEPTNISDDGDHSMYYWYFAGDKLYTGKEDLRGKPLAKNSYGHDVAMFFSNNILAAIVFFNSVPQ